MKTLFKSAIVAGLLAASAAPLPVLAQAAASGPVVPGLAVANLDAVIANSNAFKTAQTQRPTTYKAQIDSAEARSHTSLRSGGIIAPSGTSSADRSSRPGGSNRAISAKVGSEAGFIRASGRYSGSSGVP